MAKKTYSIEPQRLMISSGYVPCEPHQACRVVIIETTSVPPKGGRKAYHIKKVIEQFHGPSALERAAAACARYTHRSTPRPSIREKASKLWGRSLTINEYDALLERKRFEGSY
jgi:hypothetical protein